MDGMKGSAVNANSDSVFLGLLVKDGAGLQLQ